MKKSFLDCRLLHIDYDNHLCGQEKRNVQIESKNKLLSEFISSFNLQNSIIKNNTIVSDKEKWHFSVTHARGTTMVYFSKWVAGIDCIATIDLPNNWQELATNHFTILENEWLNGNFSKENFGKLWAAKEALFKCYFNEKDIEINFNSFNLHTNQNQFIYTKNDEKYICSQGTSDKQYIFYVCEKGE